MNRLDNLVIFFKSRVFKLRDRKIILVLKKFSIKKSKVRDKDKELNNKKKNDK